MGYDYKKSRETVINELTQKTKVSNAQSPKVEDLTFENGKRAGITACFVDIRNSTKLFSDNSETGDDKIARLMRAFSGQIIRIMRDKNYIHIGLQGDCVYGVFFTPNPKNIDEIFSMASQINSFIKMLNEILRQNNFEQIKVGIGLATGKDLIIKAGEKDSGINDVLFIGNAVVYASKNASEANKSIKYPIIADSCFYQNIDDKKKELIKNELTLFGRKVYAGDFVNSNMEKWVNNGFKDN